MGMMTTTMHAAEKTTVHARPKESAPALCAMPPGFDRWTTKRSEVTCLGCIDEICRRDSKAKK
jgi:hypothetical protein